jgi:hypothetical protein
MKKTAPKPKKKPAMSAADKKVQASIDSANRVSKMEAKADAAMKKSKKYKCGGKVKK